MSGPEPEFLQLQNAKATADLLAQLGITAPVRFAVSPTVIPVAVISTPDPASQAKLAYGAAFRGGAAGNVAHTQIFNPANSGVIIHVDSCIITLPTATEVNVTLFDTALTTASATLGYRDRRLSGSPAAQVREQNNATLLGVIRMAFDAPANEGILIPLDTFLGAAQGLVVAAVTANTTQVTTYYWEELPVGLA